MVLFAALTYAITQSNRGDAVSMSREVAESRAADIISYGNLLRDAVNKLLLRGCDETQINYGNVYLPLTNTSAPSDGRCNVFHPNGGGINARSLSDDYLNLPEIANTTGSPHNYKGIMGFNGCNRIQYLGTDTNGLASVDVLGIVTSIHPEICKAINRRYNINPPNYTPITMHIYGCWSSNPISTDGYFNTFMSDMVQKGGGCYFVNQYGGYTGYFVPLMER